MACSGITNVAIDQVNSELEASHEEVLEAGLVLVPAFDGPVARVLRTLT